MKKHLLNLTKKTNFLSVGLIILFGFFAASCSKDDEAPADTGELNIVEMLASFDQPADNAAMKSTFKTLNVALARTGLAGTVSSNQLTVFAPSDEAFAELGLNPTNIATVPNLREILLYHVVEGMVYSNQLFNGFVPTLNGAAVEINLSNGVMVNDANVVAADIKARNGVIHVIDKVLFPPTLNLVELAQSFDPEFSILVAAVVAAGEELTNTLATGGPFTVFAPTNDAFIALLGELPYNSLEEIPVEVLTQVLLYHVVEGRVYSSDLEDGPVATLNGTFQLNGTTITDYNQRDANLITSLLNVQATNGVIHVIDRVLLPEI